MQTKKILITQTMFLCNIVDDSDVIVLLSLIGYLDMKSIGLGDNKSKTLASVCTLRYEASARSDWNLFIQYIIRTLNLNFLQI